MGKNVDLTGQRFGKLTVIRHEGYGVRNNGHNYKTWLCKCDCGNEVIVRTSYLTLGETKSCGCLKSEIGKYHYEGMKFGNLTVIKEEGRDKNGNVIWLCKCDCGNDFYTTSVYLRRGFSTSCGCKTLEKWIESSKTHGMSDSKIYHVWRNMKERCYNPKNKRYKDYGGRGIIVCKEWCDDFSNFYNWAISSGYNPNAEFGECTLDRINVNGNYEPNNCRWVTNKEQQNNRQNNHYIPYNGEIRTLTEWAELYNINPRTLNYRINQSNWSIEKALETPINTKYRKKSK